jgi:hypothetical protein
MSSANGSLLCNLAHTSKKILVPLFSIFTLLLSLNGFAANGADNLGRADYDLDDDGLIEINDLADLDEIRNNLDGKTLYGSNIGCPNAEDGAVNGGCIGFELTADLDFDTNVNGKFDSGDIHWNDGSGWLPLGTNSDNFSAIFDGNGYQVKNLNIHRSSWIGLFGSVNAATIKRVGLTGSHMNISGHQGVGGLIGRLKTRLYYL